MSIRSELTLGIGNFKANLNRATEEVRRQSAEMRRESAGIGTALAGGVGKGAGMIVSRLAPVLSIAHVIAQLRKSLNFADELADLSLKAQDSAEAIQRAGFAAQQFASVDTSRLVDSMVRLERSLSDIENVNAARALERLGLSARDLAAMSIDEKVVALAEAFQQARASGTGLKDIHDLLGRQAGDLIPLFSQSGDALREMFEAAPVLADETVQALAKVNDDFEAFGARMAVTYAQVSGFLEQAKRQTRDLFETGSFQGVLERSREREFQSMQRVQALHRDRRAQAESRADDLAPQIAAAEQEQAAKAQADAARELERVFESIAARDLSLLPDEEQLAQLEADLTKLLDSTAGNFALNFETSIAGLRELLEARIALGDQLPATGVNSAIEAAEWLDQALALQREIVQRQQRLADAEAGRIDEEAKARETARARADDAEFRLLDPEEQLVRLRERLAAAVSFDGLLDWDSQDVLARVRTLREQGRYDEASDLADTLLDARRIAERIDTAGGPQGAGAQGSFASFMDQLFGRGVPEQQLDESRRTNQQLRDHQRTLDRILAKMDEPPEPDRFTDFPR